MSYKIEYKINEMYVNINTHRQSRTWIFFKIHASVGTEKTRSLKWKREKRNLRYV